MESWPSRRSKPPNCWTSIPGSFVIFDWWARSASLVSSAIVSGTPCLIYLSTCEETIRRVKKFADHWPTLAPYRKGSTSHEQASLDLPNQKGDRPKRERRSQLARWLV